MRKFLMAAFGACAIAGAVAAPASADGMQPNIIGGHNASETYSFMVALSNGCGGSLVAVPRETVTGRVPPRTFRWLDQYWKCERCGKVFWHGSHWQRIAEQLRQVMGSPLGPEPAAEAPGRS